jgi:segregation and condensation protein B
MEALAIVAYRQPVTRPGVEEIRGVDSGSVLRTLLERDLIKITGRKDLPGRPIIYGTTKAFLELFGLNALSDLPTLKEVQPPPTTEEASQPAMDVGAIEEVSGPNENEGLDLNGPGTDTENLS